MTTVGHSLRLSYLPLLLRKKKWCILKKRPLATGLPPTYELIDQDKEQIIGMNEDELAALETKLNDSCEIVAIQKQLLNLIDKTQLQSLTSLISNLDDKISKQKKDLKQLIDNINPETSNQFNAHKVLQFINGRENVETKELEINDENSKAYPYLYEIKTSGKYIDRLRMSILPDKEDEVFGLGKFHMILETETPPSVSIIRNPEPQNIEEQGVMSFLRTSTDFEYVKLYFVNTDLFTSIDIHKNQQDNKFIIFSSIIESEIVGGIYTYTCMIKINIKKPKISVHLIKINDSKEEISIVTVEVTIFKTIEIYHGSAVEMDILDKNYPSFKLSEIHLI
ncbi:hypothetical protein LOTGIDRAFT_173155 [Lottia gigantea]|uniref:Uncharacterized protein n=1 Tax=Lottia gigantea TaxID=225164 RepID=V4A906_LOTGI|nr:hypothetical protein LOTGIDRAFT_173155 [Lottia gigantea]ESP00424.1 hypothetical protein LOTGIDRAFT_173155 [Lottia gigantea]